MFIREIEVIVGNKRFFGDGGDDTWKIRFEVSKAMLGYPNTATVTLTNLKNDTFDQLLERGLPVEISVGHRDTELLRVFKGDLQSTIISRANTDRETVITCLDGGQAITFTKSQKIYDVTPIATIVEELAGDLGLPIGKIDVEGETGYKGRVISSNTKRELDNLSREFGFSWSIQDGEFFAIRDTGDIPTIWEISRKTGLQSAKQIFSGALQVKNGVEIQALMNPKILPNHIIRLKWFEGSDFPESLAGDYKVHNINFAGDTHGQDWTMNLQSFIRGIGAFKV
jgi:hypothetical protein